MNQFYENLIQFNINENMIKENQNLLNLDVVEYLYKNNYMDYLKLVLQNLNNDFDIINKFFIYQELFDEFKDLLINYTKFYETLRLPWIHFEKLSLKTLEFLIENNDLFTYKLNKNDIYYLVIKLNKNTDNYELDEHYTLQFVIDLYYKKNELDKLELIINNYTNYSLVRLMIDNINENIEKLIWLMNKIQEKQVIQEIDLIDIFNALMKSNDIKFIKWFIKNYIDFLPFFKIFYNICDYNRIDILKIIIDLNLNLFLNYINNNDINYWDYTIELFEFMNNFKVINIEPLIIWNMFLKSSNRIKYLEYIDKNYEIDWENLKNVISNDLLFLDSLEIIDFLNKKNSQLLYQHISSLFNVAIIRKNINLIKYYLENFKNSINLEHLIYKKDLIIKDYEIFQLIEQNLNLSIIYYDYIITINAKIGEEKIITYIKNKYPNRYNLKLLKYVYKINNYNYSKLYDIEINIVKNIYNDYKLNEECIICLESKNTMIKTNCKHYYCEECFNLWYYNNINNYKCAYCRQYIIEIDKNIKEI
jgi:hypothetical protein